jgi:hypothetical protein
MWSTYESTLRSVADFRAKLIDRALPTAIKIKTRLISDIFFYLFPFLRTDVGTPVNVVKM